MKISELLNAMASWLESPENEAMLLSEYNDKCLEIVARSCIEAAAILKKAADEVNPLDLNPEAKFVWKVYLVDTNNPDDDSPEIASFTENYEDGMSLVKDIVTSQFGEEYKEEGNFGITGGYFNFISSEKGQEISVHIDQESAINEESIEDLANLAHALDSSGDENLMKQASVLDELLLTIAAPPNAVAEKKAAENYRLEELKKKYQNPKKELDETNKIADSIKDIDKSKITKEYKVLEAPLSTRTCPDHPGAQIARVGEHIWQCELDKKTYNFETGFELSNGSRVPGGDVAQQTQGLSVDTHSIFDTREGRLQTNQA